MTTVTILVGIGIFLIARSLFLFGPAQEERDLVLGALVLQPRAATGLSILLMVFGSILALKSFAE